MVKAKAGAAGLREAQSSPVETSLDFSFTFRLEDLVRLPERVRMPGILPVLAAGLLLRLVLALIPPFQIDTGTFRAWSDSLARDNPWNFYKTDFFTDYAPGYMYVLWFIGKLNQLFHFNQETFECVLKLPSIAADLASAYVLYLLLKDQKQEWRVGAAAIYLLFPAVLIIGPIWGQVDSLLAFLLLLSIYFIDRERPMAGALVFTLGFLTKPQIIATLPFLAVWIMRRNPPRVWLQITGASLALLLVVIFPFFTFKPWDLIPQLYDATNVENYRVKSFFAYNFWNIGGLFEGFKPDVTGIQPGQGTLLGIDYRYWGFALFATSIVGIIRVMWNSRGTGALALGSALSVYVFYMFMTRMHERYVFAAFLPLLAAAVTLHSRTLLALFGTLGMIHFFNLYHVYVYYQHDLRWNAFYKWFEKSNLLGTGLETVQVLSLLMVVGLPFLIAVAYRISNRAQPAGVT